MPVRRNGDIAGEKSPSTVRFAALVAKCGKPEPVDLWLGPEGNPGFKTAVREGRVLTIVSPAKGKEYGRVGFEPDGNSSYVVFPCSLGEFKESRVIGIKYEDIRVPSPVGTRVQPKEKATRRLAWQDRGNRIRAGLSAQEEAVGGNEREDAREPDRKEVETEVQTQRSRKRDYKVTVRFIAETEVTLEASSATEAAAKAEKMAKPPRAKHLDFRKEVVSLAELKPETER